MEIPAFFPTGNAYLHAWDIKYTNLFVRGATKPTRWQTRHWYDLTTTLCDHPTRPSIWKEAALIFFALRLHIPLILPLMLFLLAFSPSMGHLVISKKLDDFYFSQQKSSFWGRCFFIEKFDHLQILEKDFQDPTILGWPSSKLLSHTNEPNKIRHVYCFNAQKTTPSRLACFGLGAMSSQKHWTKTEEGYFSWLFHQWNSKVYICIYIYRTIRTWRPWRWSRCLHGGKRGDFQTGPALSVSGVVILHYTKKTVSPKLDKHLSSTHHSFILKPLSLRHIPFFSPRCLHFVTLILL